jgi:BirA family biotin operon repressor/biotin-[acetyl-CoA-carboxylase] ligase
LNKKYFTDKNLIELDVVDSTNNYTANLLLKTKLVDRSVIMAHFQTSGRGQRGEVWESEPGKNLLFSLVLKADCLDTENYFLLSKIVAISINEVIEDLSGKIGFIKWPNDIYMEGKKIGGILIENQWKGKYIDNAIIGVGLNINQVNFDYLQQATSLSLLTSKTFDLHEILHMICLKVDVYYQKLVKKQFKKIDQYYFEHLLYSNEWKYYKLEDGSLIEGMITDVKPNGLLSLQLMNGETKEFNFKEIEFRI